ncbi:MAG TPA: shikimate dehydrogenase [Calditrichaeota bacterium]|nr:shikimate dehydrogenase [Calditrichota bacterium]
MKKFAIIGYPLSHSASPYIHNAAFELYGIDAQYGKLEINPDRFDEEIQKIKKENWTGFNITIPHKQRIMSYLDSIDPVAQRIGAVNTIKVEAGGRWVGYNTDYQGFLKPLEPYRRQIRSCLLAGAGGAARAVAFALCDLPNIAHLSLLNRNPQKGLALKNELERHRSIDYQTRELNDKTADKEYDLLVNATPLGMGELKDQLPFDPIRYAHRKTIVYDLIYNPQETLFLKQAQKDSLKTINGWPMLLGQAEAAFHIWTRRGFTEELKHYIESTLLG